MPRKVPDKSAASAARVRDNQRASRARKRELLESLQRRLAEYELGGVQATVEMQRAAREVSEENRRLRELLQLRGVSADEIERFLCRGPRSDCPNDLGIEADSSSNCSNSSGNRQHEIITCSGQGTTAACGVRRTVPCSQDGASASAADQFVDVMADAIADHGTYATQQTPEGHELNTLGPDADFEGAMEVFMSIPSTLMSGETHLPLAAEATGARGEPIGSALEMSCENAAAVLAQLQGHGDTRLARQALECVGDQDNCTVKNIRVLELVGQGD